MVRTLIVILAFSVSAPASAVTIVGFSRSGRQVLFRDAEGALQLYRRDGRAVDGPPTGANLERRYRYGKPTKAGELRLEGRKLQLKRKGQLVTVWRQDVAESCAVAGLGESRLARNRMVLAVVLKQDCDKKEQPLVISLSAVARRLAQQAVAQARKGKRKQSALALKQASALQPRSPLVLYSRARAAALAADQSTAIRLLKQLKAMRSAGARRLLVKAQFDRDFRLIESSAAFKELFRF